MQAAEPALLPVMAAVGGRDPPAVSWRQEVQAVFCVVPTRESMSPSQLAWVAVAEQRSAALHTLRAVEGEE